MANTLDTIVPKIMARTMKKLRRNAALPKLVTRDYQDQLASKGDTVTIPISAPVTAAAVTPSMTFPTPSDVVIPKATITLDQWRQTSGNVRDDEVAKADVDQLYIPGQVEECMAALVDEAHAFLAGLYKGVYGIVGTAGTTPFASDSNVLADANWTLTTQLAPKVGRKAVIDLNAAKNLQKLAELKNAYQAGDASMIREGQIGRLLGLDIEDCHYVASHASTALTAGAATINGAQAINAGSTDNGRTGTISVAKATNSAPLVVGDIIEFTVGGVVQQHVVTANTTLAVGNTSVPVAPALRVATAGAEAVTLRASHTVNLAFLPGAFGLVVRPPKDLNPLMTSGADNEVYTWVQPDPVTGLAIRVQIKRGYMMRAWYFDILYGGACVRPELACRIAG